jgi:hypothetical protein
VSDALEDGLPHTRGNAIMIPFSVLETPDSVLVYVMSHEVFHVLSRNDPALREALYNAIGFRPCASVEVPPAMARLRVTNPDAPVSRHAIRVRVRGEPAEALPYLMFRSPDADPRAGFREQVQTAWLLVAREGERCRAGGRTVPREELAGLDEQVGRNTRYLLHAEEILADNFSILFIGSLREGPPDVPSPEILERMRAILGRQ